MISLAAGGYRITGNLNEGIGDAGPGTANAGTTGLPTVDGALGQLGGNLFITQEEAANYTNTAATIPVLYGGFYRYVRMLAGAVAAVAAGQLCFWSDPVNGVVTTDVTAATIGQAAGVILSTAWVKGNYWWVFSGGGICYVKCAAAVTGTTAGQLAIVTQTPAPTVDSLADATAVTDAVLKSQLGTFLDAAANGAIKRIYMNQLTVGTGY